MIYQLSLTFQKDREIYIPTKKKKDVCGCLLWLYTLQYYFETCSWRDFQYSSITHALLITISIKSPPFTITHIKKEKFWAGQGGQVPPLDPPDSAPALNRGKWKHAWQRVGGRNGKLSYDMNELMILLLKGNNL